MRSQEIADKLLKKPRNEPIQGLHLIDWHQKLDLLILSNNGCNSEQL
jgi:hypothetical protein